MNRTIAYACRTGLLLAVVAGGGFACADECSSPRDCPRARPLCIQGACQGKGDADVVIPPRPDRPDFGPLPPPPDGGADADVGDPPVPDGGDAGDPTPATLIGTIRAWQYESTLRQFQTGAEGRIADVTAVTDPMNPFERTVTPIIDDGTTRCELIEIGTPEPGIGVQIERVEGAQVGGASTRAFAMDSQSTGELVPQLANPVPSPLFVGPRISGTRSIDFDVTPNARPGQPDVFATTSADVPARFGPVAPSEGASLDVRGPVQFVFEPVSVVPSELELVVRIFDRADRPTERPRVIAECRASLLAATTYLLPGDAGQAFFAAQPAPEGGVDLEIGFESRTTVTPGVQGGGEARFDFELFRGALYPNIVVP